MANEILRRIIPGFILVFVLAICEIAASADALTPPADRKIKVAFLLGRGSTMIDFTGPWEVFQDVMVTPSGKAVLTHEAAMQSDIRSPFELYVVSEKKELVSVSGGMKIMPDYVFADAPQPDVIVIPAQRDSIAAIEWLKKNAPKADVTMSVCTGAYMLAEAGLLNGLSATTHHWFVDSMIETFPSVKFVKDRRYVENEKYSTAAGLTSGIDMALRVVERYYGRQVAVATAQYMEHNSPLWK